MSILIWFYKFWNSSNSLLQLLNTEEVSDNRIVYLDNFFIKWILGVLGFEDASLISIMEECEVIESDVKVKSRQQKYIQSLSPVDLSATNEKTKVDKRKCHFKVYSVQNI